MESQKQERRVKEMKRVTKIIALASIFSLVISYSSLIFSLQHRLQYLLSMYSNLVDKKFMFLLCNGIVGLILGSFRGNSETHLHSKSTYIVEQTRQVKIREMRVTQAMKSVALLEDKNVSKQQQEQQQQQEQEEEEEQQQQQEQEEEEEEEQQQQQQEQEGEEEEDESVALLRRGREEVSKEEEERVAGVRQELALVVEDDEANLVQDLAIFRIVDHNDDETDDSLSEDINQKCEEFIRKMKANIRLESRKMKYIRLESRKMITL